MTDQCFIATRWPDGTFHTKEPIEILSRVEAEARAHELYEVPFGVAEVCVFDWAESPVLRLPPPPPVAPDQPKAGK